jgi:hypothetical protein
VAVGNVMDKLPDGPAAGPVGGVELLRRQPAYGGAELGRRGGDFVNPLSKLLLGSGASPFEFSYWILQVCHSSTIQEWRWAPSALPVSCASLQAGR